jgi:hypothetical protein
MVIKNDPNAIIADTMPIGTVGLLNMSSLFVDAEVMAEAGDRIELGADEKSSAGEIWLNCDMVGCGRPLTRLH